MNKYDFKRVDWKFDKILVCPKCFEMLYRTDIEHFKHCPYCNYKLDLDIEIEDYLLKPTVDKWIALQHLASHGFMNIAMIANNNEQTFF